MNASYEDIFFYLDLTKEVLKKKDIIKTIRNYISEKNKINLKGHYGLLIFQEEGNPIFITDKKDSVIIANAIEENWKTRPKEQSFFENGLFYIFSYIAETVRKKAKFNRIIIITDTPSDLSEEYTDALFNLVSKIKNFPTFIDILRITESNTRFFKDDVKLNILASDTKGSIFYIREKKEFTAIMEKLIKMKQLVSIFADQTAKIQINREDYEFYTHLAKKLILSPKNESGLKCSLCNDEVCPVCVDVNDLPLLCSNCGTAFHKCCIINYSINHNIGIPHIFRCPKCDILSQIDQDEIVHPEDPNIESAEEYIESFEEDFDEEPFIEETESEYSDYESESYEIEEFESTINQEERQASESAHKTIRIGGFFGKTYTVRKERDKLVYQRTFGINKQVQDENVEFEEEDPSIVWKPEEKDDEKPSYYICSVCGNQMNSKEHDECPNCGTKMQK